MSKISSAVKDCSNTLDVKDSSNCSDSSTALLHFEERFHRLLEDNLFTDCEFVVGPQNVVIKGHKAVFAVASEVFQAMFYGGFKENKTIEIVDLDPEGFTGMKRFIYTGLIHFTSAIHALQTYNCARKYLISPLSQLCVEHMLFTKPSEVLEVYEYCKTTIISEFDETCYKIIQERTDEVVESEHFLESSVDAIELILQSPSLRLTSEVEVFIHFERWALAERDRMKASGISDEEMTSVFNRLKKHIRFLTMSRHDEFLSKAEFLSKSSLLTIEEKDAILISQLKNCSYSLPESISMSKIERNFLHSECIWTYPYIKMIVLLEQDEDDTLHYPVVGGEFFKLPITSEGEKSFVITLQHETIIRTNNIVDFLIKPHFIGSTNDHLPGCNTKLTLFMKSKLTVRNANGGDNMTFEKRFQMPIRVGFDPQNNQDGVIVAKVPLNELLPLRDDEDSVTIDVRYNYEYIDALCPWWCSINFTE